MGGALASNDDAVEGENKYVNHLLQCSGLKLLQERRAKKVLMGQRRSWAYFFGSYASFLGSSEGVNKQENESSGA